MGLLWQKSRQVYFLDKGILKMEHQVTLNDFEADDGFHQTFNHKINGLLEVSPSDSGASTNIFKTKTGYLGRLQLYSSQGKFVVESASRDIDELVKSMFNLMHGKVKNWRKFRIVTE